MATKAYQTKHHGFAFWAGITAAAIAAIPALDSGIAQTITRRRLKPRFQWLDAAPGAPTDVVVVAYHGLWAPADMHKPLLDVLTSLGRVLLVSNGAEVTDSVKATLDELEQHGLLDCKLLVDGPSLGSVVGRSFSEAYEDRTGRQPWGAIFLCPMKDPEHVIWPRTFIPLHQLARVIRGGPLANACWKYINRRSLAKATAAGDISDRLMSALGRSQFHLATVASGARLLHDKGKWPKRPQTTPTLVIYQAEDDRVLTGDWSASPNVTVVVLDDEPGHTSFHRSHESYRRKITEWIEGLAAAA
jgi:hypothetical protein